MSNKLIKIRDQSMDVMQLGDVLSKSGFFQDTKQAAQAVVKVLAANELGIGPIAGMTGIYIVKGKVTLSANLIAAVIKRSQAYDYRVRQMDSDGCRIEFFQNGESIGVSEFTAADAKAASLGGDNWKKYPRNMLFARAMSNGAKWYCPDVFSGSPVYTPDELGAEIDGETGEIIDAMDYEVSEETVQRVIEDRQDAKQASGKPKDAMTAFWTYVKDSGIDKQAALQTLNQDADGNAERALSLLEGAADVIPPEAEPVAA